MCKLRNENKIDIEEIHLDHVIIYAQTYLQLPLWGSGNVYLLLLSSWKVNIAKNSIAVMGL